jgi:hypothetical protein
MKKLFIGNFGGKNKEDWFFSWADDKEDAIKTIKKEFGEPVFIEDITDTSSGGFCFKPINISKDDDPYFLLEPYQDDFRFKNDEYIQKIIIKQIYGNILSEDKQRDEYRRMIENENLKQKNKEETEYQKIRDQIDNLKI